MELHERLVTTKPSTAAPPPTQEPFADLKNEIHMLVITELGPQMTGQVFDAVGMRDRVLADIRRHLSHADRDLARRPRAARRRRSPTTSSATARSSACSPTTRSRRSWSTARARSGSSARAGSTRPTVRFGDDSHLRRIINRMVAQVGRRIDESSPMVDARLPDGSPRQRDHRAALALRPAAHDPEVLAQAARARRTWSTIGTLSDESVDFLAPLHPGAAQHPHLRRHRLGQDDAPERALRRDPGQRADRHDRGRRRAPAPPAARAAARVAAEEHRGRGRGPDPRPRAQLAAHAPRPDHRRRGPRRRGARHAPGDEHGPRRLALDRPRERAARRARPRRDDGADGRATTCPMRAIRQQVVVGARHDRPPRAPRGRLPARDRRSPRCSGWSRT